MQYQTETSKTKRRLYLVKCSECKETHTVQAAQFKIAYSEYCVDCANKNRKRILK